MSSPWVLRGLRNGVVTTRWPARPDPYADQWRGQATLLARQPDAPVLQPAQARPDLDRAADAAGAQLASDLAGLCPTGAIGVTATGSGVGGSAVTAGDVARGQAGAIRIDQGRCIQCGRCVEQRPDLFGWSFGPAAAGLSRDALVVGGIEETDAGLAAVRDELRARTAALRRSVHLRHVDAGSDGAEEQEIAALLNPVYDIHRLGIFITASPRHADILLVTGAGAHGMAEPLRRAYDGMPDPKVVIAIGTDAVSGGLVTGPGGSYAAAGGIGSILPVDVWVPGSPPSPFTILHAILAALGRLPWRSPGEPAQDQRAQDQRAQDQQARRLARARRARTFQARAGRHEKDSR